MIFYMQVKLDASWVQSLKEKRMVVKSLTGKLKNKFNISVIESAYQDLHKTILIDIAGLASDSDKAENYMENIIRYVEENTDAQITDTIKTSYKMSIGIFR